MTVRVAVIGTGWWGRQHARVFRDSSRSSLVAIVGRSPEKTAKRAAEFGVPGYTDIDAMLASERPDLVTVCLPNTEHFAPTLKLIDVGMPLFVEKPLAFELDECDALLKAAVARNLFFAINFNHRYAKPAQLAKAAIDAGRLGELVFATWRFGGEGSSAHDPFANLIETQCHGFDLLEYLCGPIVSVAAEMSEVGGNVAPGTVVVALRFGSGAVGALIGSYASSYAYRGAHLLEINGTHGRILAEDTVRRFSFQALGSETAEVWEPGYFNDFERSFERTFDKHASAVLKAYEGGRPPPVHAAAGRRALEIARACIRSWETGARVTL